MAKKEKVEGGPVKISPSTMSYALDGCLRCLWLAMNKGESWPRAPMAGIFNKIDSGMKKVFQGMKTHQIDALPLLPPGHFDSSKVEWVECAPFESRSGKLYFFKGKVDSLIRFDDLSGGVVDYKTSDLSTDKITKYARQLFAYLWCLESPAKAKPLLIQRMGLVSFEPDPGKFSKYEDAAGRYIEMSMSGRIGWHEVSCDEQARAEFTEKVMGLCDMLEGPMPVPGTEYNGEDCKQCQMRSGFQAQGFVAAT